MEIREDTLPESAALDQVEFDERGLVPVVAQEANSGEVLMLAYANREALRLTLESGQAHYFSRSRGALWRKGESSGNTQAVAGVRLDCDGDADIYSVVQEGPACHTGERSCFHRNLPLAGGSQRHSHGDASRLLDEVVGGRLAQLPEGSYVTRLHERGPGYTSQKVVEEAGETIVAALQGEDEELQGEAADLLFHLTVLLHQRGTSLAGVGELLKRRHEERRR